MPPTIIYIHGQNGSPEEAEHYRPLFPGCEVIGFDYKAQTPWEAEREFAEYFDGLEERGCIEGVTLDEEHLRYVRQHPIDWHVPTHILYGENDNLTSLATISDFARRTGATLEVMPGGEHWFHTPEQMAFLDEWLLQYMQ